MFGFTATDLLSVGSPQPEEDGSMMSNQEAAKAAAAAASSSKAIVTPVSPRSPLSAASKTKQQEHLKGNNNTKSKQQQLQRRNNSSFTMDADDEAEDEEESRCSTSFDESPPPLALITATSSCSWTASPTDSSSSEKSRRRPKRTTTAATNCTTTLFSRIRQRVVRKPGLFYGRGGKPPLMKTRLRVEDDGGIETFYYNPQELDYSDDDEDDDEQQDGAALPVSRNGAGKGRTTAQVKDQSDRTGSFSRGITVGGYCSSLDGGPTSSLKAGQKVISFDSGVEKKQQDDYDDGFSDDDDSLAGAMCFLSNESTLLEFSADELVKELSKEHSLPKRRLSLSSFRSTMT
ncbi:MAG: hypothetical protein SGILL_002746 [Bacillariaceae sp.]